MRTCIVKIVNTGINGIISLAWHFMWLALKLWLSFLCSVKIPGNQFNIHCWCFALCVFCPSCISWSLTSSLQLHQTSCDSHAMGIQLWWSWWSWRLAVARRWMALGSFAHLACGRPRSRWGWSWFCMGMLLVALGVGCPLGHENLEHLQAAHWAYCSAA